MHYISQILHTILFITLGAFPIYAQQATGSSGGDVNGSVGSVSFSVGLPDYTNFEGSGGKISLGVQQPLVVIMVDTDEPERVDAISAFPNPANNAIYLKVNQSYLNETTDHRSFTLFDIHGKLLEQGEIKNELTSISVNEFANGMYLLRVISNHKEVNLFKIFKTN